MLRLRTFRAIFIISSSCDFLCFLLRLLRYGALVRSRPPSPLHLNVLNLRQSRQSRDHPSRRPACVTSHGRRVPGPPPSPRRTVLSCDSCLRDLSVFSSQTSPNRVPSASHGGNFESGTKWHFTMDCLGHLRPQWQYISAWNCSNSSYLPH